MYKNFSPNVTLRYAHGHAPNASSGTTNGDAVDLAADGAHTIAYFVQTTARAAANSSQTVKLQHRDSTSASWADIPGCTVTYASADDKNFVVVETNTDAARLKRYVRGVVTRATGASEIAAGFYVLCSGLRRTGVIVKGDVAAGVIGQERSSFVAP